jgi:hypothetical protein
VCRCADELQDLTTTIDVDELSSRMLAAGQLLLKHFVSQHGDRLGLMIRKSMATADWMKRKEPRDSRPAVDAVVEEVSALQTNRVVPSVCFLVRAEVD